LRAAQEEFADDAEFLGREFQGAVFGVAETVLVLGDAAAEAAVLADQVALDEQVDRLLHGRVIELQHRVAIALLVAGVHQRVERERILLGRGDFLFDQAGDDAGFEGGQFDGHLASWARLTAPVMVRKWS